MTRKKRIIFIFLIATSCQLSTTMSSIMGESGADPEVIDPVEAVIVDPVMDYYISRSKAVLESGNPFKRGISFSFEAVSIYEIIGRKGRVEFSDTSKAVYYYSFGELDSMISDSNFSGERRPTFKYENIFAGDFIFNFFPNDTGGEDLAIGFESDSITNNEPVGIAIINRNTLFLKRLYLHYPLVSEQEQVSRTFSFKNIDGFHFCEAITEVGAKYSVFSLDYYLLETLISNIQIRK